jgi:hypothetical protein
MLSPSILLNFVIAEDMDMENITKLTMLTKYGIVSEVPWVW